MEKPGIGSGYLKFSEQRLKTYINKSILLYQKRRKKSRKKGVKDECIKHSSDHHIIGRDRDQRCGDDPVEPVKKT